MKTHRFPTILFSLLAIISFGSANAADAKKAPLFSSDLNGGDIQFLIAATQQGVLLAALGDLAATHAQSAEVKTFGQTLTREFSAQNEQIKLLAIKKSFTLPESSDPQKNPVTGKLAKLKGLKFDKAYMEEMLQQQQNYVSIFEQGSLSQDPDIKSFALSVLPVIKQHLAFLKSTTGSAPRSEATPHFRVDVGDPDKPDAGKN